LLTFWYINHGKIKGIECMLQDWLIFCISYPKKNEGIHLWVELNLCRFFVLFVHICIVAGDPIIKMTRVEIPFIRFSPPHKGACPYPGPGYPTLYVVVFRGESER
jgi:hypothetical protein